MWCKIDYIKVCDSAAFSAFTAVCEVEMLGLRGPTEARREGGPVCSGVALHQACDLGEVT